MKVAGPKPHIAIAILSWEEVFLQISYNSLGLFDHVLSSDSTTEIQTQYWSRAKAQANHKTKDEGDLIS